MTFDLARYIGLLTPSLNEFHVKEDPGLGGRQKPLSEETEAAR